MSHCIGKNVIVGKITNAPMWEGNINVADLDTTLGVRIMNSRKSYFVGISDNGVDWFHEGDAYECLSVDDENNYTFTPISVKEADELLAAEQAYAEEGNDTWYAKKIQKIRKDLHLADVLGYIHQ